MSYIGKRTYTASGLNMYNPPAKRRSITTYARNGRTQNTTVVRRQYSRPQAGPYRALTSGGRHTNPTYPRPEIKFIDIDAAGVVFAGSSPQVITNNGFVICLNQLAQGLTPSSRIGTSVSVKSCAYRFELDLPPLTTNQVPTSGRVMLVWDKQPNGTVPVYSAIFTVASYLSFMNVGNVDRFTILRNQQFSLSPNGDQVLFFEGYCKINMQSTWLSTQVTAGVPQTGSLLLIYIGDQSTAANQPTISGDWRVRYLDC